jgi:predicted membrane protein
MISLKKHKSFVIIFIIVFFVSWALGVLRFHYQWAHILNSILLFPCGFLHITLDNYIWLHIRYPIRYPILRDDFFGLFTFLLSIIGQTFIYYWIYKKIMNRRKNKKESSWGN